MAPNEETKKLNVMVFAPERVGLPTGMARIETKQFGASFETINSPRRFEEFDGVIVFQRTFESLAIKTGPYTSYVDHKQLRDELDRRHKQTRLLIEKGGFVCFVLCLPLLDMYHTQKFYDTDLVKRYLLGSSFYRTDFDEGHVAVKAEMPEFDIFLSRFGRAHTYFEYNRQSLDLRKLASLGQYCVGLVGIDQVFFVPALIPSWGTDVVHDFFELLLTAVTSTFRRLRVEVPAWARSLEFVEEVSLRVLPASLHEIYLA